MADMPPPHQCIAESDGITKWRPLIDGLRVSPLRDGGRRLEVEIGGLAKARFDLSAEQATHLANLISPAKGEQPAEAARAGTEGTKDNGIHD